MRFAPACGRKTGDERCEAISARAFGRVSGCESHETDRRAAAAAEDTLTTKAHQHIPDTSHMRAKTESHSGLLFFFFLNF